MNSQKTSEDAPASKALRTAKWARTMTKWLVTYSQRRGARWQVVDFCGPVAESRGIVDLIAIRKDHRSTTSGTKRGDIFEIVLIQCKGGSAAGPSKEDAERLRRVAAHHRAKAIVLAEWKQGKAPNLYQLNRNRWIQTTAREIF